MRASDLLLDVLVVVVCDERVVDLFDELHVAADAACRIFAVVSADQFALVENIYSELAAAAKLT